MPRQYVQWRDTHLGLDTGAHAAQQVIQHPTHGEHRGATVNVDTVDFPAVHFATRSGRGLNHRDIKSLVRQCDGTAQTTHARTDDDDLVLRHGWAPGCGHPNWADQWAQRLAC